MLRTVRRTVRLSILATLVLTAPLAAQARLEAGSPIRVVADSAGTRRTLEGTVVSVFPDLLTIVTTGDARTHTIPVGNVRELYGFAPRDPARSAWRGAQTWGFVGATLGAVGSVGINIAIEGDLATTAAISTATGLAIGALGGAAAGAVLSEAGWQKYQIPREWMITSADGRSLLIAIRVR